MFDAPETDIEAVATQLVSAVLDLQVAPTVFFGHSLGGLLAYEVAYRLLETNERYAPKKVVLSGCSPPHIEKDEEDGPVWELSEESFIERLRRLDGTPEEVLGSRELLDLFLPVLRADFQLAYNAREALKRGLRADTHILGGLEDVEATEAHLKQWQQYLTNEAALTMFPGSHFFLNDHPQQVCAILEKHLMSVMCASAVEPF